MNYLLFNNEILISDGANVTRIKKGAENERIFESIGIANVCVVDVDVLIASAVEFPVEKKDSILVRKFNELYQHEAYIIQDEKIDSNLFQVIGIKEQKVRQIYSLIPVQKIKSLIPYGMAIRNALINKNVDLNKTIVFVDDLGGERLLTVFNGLKFSRTRVIANNGEDILPEIKRSQIDFFKKNEEHLNKGSADFVIVVNKQPLADEISKNGDKLTVECLNFPYPALEGLKEIDTPIKYRLPEEILKKRKEIELRKNVHTTVLSLSVVLAGSIFFLFNKIELGLIRHQYQLTRQAHGRLDEQLSVLDKETYRQDLRARKYLNYGVTYLSLLELVPPSYMVNSFKFFKTGKWVVEVDLFAGTDGFFDLIPRVKILTDAQIKDIFVNNQPGKHLRIIL